MEEHLIFLRFNMSQVFRVGLRKFRQEKKKKKKTSEKNVFIEKYIWFPHYPLWSCLSFPPQPLLLEQGVYIDFSLWLSRNTNTVIARSPASVIDCCGTRPKTNDKYLRICRAAANVSRVKTLRLEVDTEDWQSLEVISSGRFIFNAFPRLTGPEWSESFYCCRNPAAVRDFSVYSFNRQHFHSSHWGSYGRFIWPWIGFTGNTCIISAV